MSGLPHDGIAVSIGLQVLAAAMGVALLASAAAAQLAGPIPPEATPEGGAEVLTVPDIAACLDALRRTGTRTAVADGVSCAVGTTTHLEQVGHCLFRPATGGSMLMLELFREPATHPGRGEAATGGGPFVCDAGVAVDAPGLPAARVCTSSPRAGPRQPCTWP